LSAKNIMNRRGFVKSATAATAAILGFPYIVPSAALGKDGNVAPSNRISIGCIGAGGQGLGDLNGFLNKSRARVAAICDVDKSRRDNAINIVNKTYGNTDCAGYDDLREVINRPDIDAVTIALPDHWHAIAAIMAARAGKDIHGQKPLAYNISEGRAIVNAVKKYNVVWQTGSQQRSDRNFRFACELVRNGRLGKVNTIKVGLPSENLIFGNWWKTAPPRYPAKPIPVPDGFDYDMWLGPAPEAPYTAGRCHWNFRWISDYAHGQISDWAGHHCDIAHWAMNTEHSAPVEIEGSGTFPDHPIYNTVENFRFVCKYKQGFTVIVSGEYPRGVRFEGSDGWIFVNRSGIQANPKSLLDTIFGPEETHLYRSNDHKQNFLDCVQSRRTTVAPAEAAHYSIMVGHLGVIAIRLGRKLRWNPQKERFVDDPQADRMLSRPMRSPWQVEMTA